jgi:hypothetical protein
MCDAPRGTNRGPVQQVGTYLAYRPLYVVRSGFQYTTRETSKVEAAQK